MTASGNQNIALNQNCEVLTFMKIQLWWANIALLIPFQF